MSTRRSLFKIVFGAFAMVLISGLLFYSISNNSNRQNDDGRIRVTTSFYPLYDFTRNIGREKIVVTNILPPGAEPHDYEPSPQQLAQIADSQLFLYLGGNFEPWVEKFLQDSKVSAVKVADGLEPSPDPQDPHVWLDPVFAGQMSQITANWLSTVDSKNADFYADNVAAYKLALNQLDADIEAGLKNCKSRTVVTAHDAFGYFGKRYNLEVIPIAGLSPDQEPDAEKLAELSSLVKQKGVTTIFFETLTSPRLAETLAAETGATTAVLNPIEGMAKDNKVTEESYVTIQRQNLQALQTALTCI